ncbi:MAG: hypothetical protein LBE65_01590 [Synergistaceae bacterium]|nr:hypothetical protein [Synergistaceae bacterium]
MFNVGKIKIFRASFALLSVLSLCCYYVLSGSTFLADVVAQKVEETLKQIDGMEVTWESAAGNPITGITMSGLKIYAHGAETASLGEFGLRFSLETIASSQPRISKVVIKKFVSDFGALTSLPLNIDNSSGTGLDVEVTLVDSTIDTKWGSVFLSDANFSSNAADFSFRLRGKFRDTAISADGKGDMSGDTVNLEKFSGGFGDTRVFAAGKLAPSLAMNCELRNIDAAFVSSFFPEFENNYVGGVYSAEFAAALPNFSSPLAPEISGTVTSPGGTLWKFLFGGMSAKFYYGDGSLRFRDAELDIFKGRVSGALDLDFTPDAAPKITARLNADSIDTKTMETALPWLASFPGIIEAASCDVSGPLNSLSGRASLYSPSFNPAGFSCAGVRADISIKNGAVFDADFLGGIEGAPMKGKGVVLMKDGVNVSADISIPKISAESLYKKFPPLKDLKVTGTAGVNLGINGPASALRYVSSISLRNVGIMDDYRLSPVTAEISYDGDSLSIKSSEAKWNGASVTANGDLKLSANAPARFALKGKISGLDIANLSGFIPAIGEYELSGTASGSWSLDGDAKTPIAKGEISIPAFRSGKNKLMTDVKAAVSYARHKIDVSKLAFNVDGSPVTASGFVTPPSGDSPLGCDIKGAFDEINPSAFAEFGVPKDVSGNLRGDVRIRKTGGAPPSVSVFFKDASLGYGEKTQLSGINGTVTYSGGSVFFDKLRTSVNAGNISLGGTIRNAASYGKPSAVPLDLALTVTSADIDRAARIFNPMSKGFQGTANGLVSIKGDLASPRISAEGTLRGVRAFGFFLPVVDFRGVRGDKKRVEFPDVRAAVGRGFINVSGSVDLSGDPALFIDAAGTSVDIRALTSTLERDVRRAITGALDFNFKGRGPMAAFKGKGWGKIPELTVFGLKARDVEAGFSVNDGFAIVEDSSAKAYDGEINVQFVKDFNSTDWGGTLRIKSADIAPAFGDFMPDSEGSITGTANFTTRFTGDSRRTSMLDGSGALDIYDGEISGFDGARKISEMFGGKPLRYNSGHFTFSLDGKNVNIIPGSRIIAPKEDQIYKYVMFDGNVTTDLEMYLNCDGNINLRALNALVSGLRGVLSTAVEKGEFDDSREMLRNFLGNAITGYSADEFRGVAMNVRGKPEELTFSDISIASPVKMDTLPDVLKNNGSNGAGEDAGVKITVEIPVGPGGGENSPGNVGKQVSGQILDQLIKSLVFDDE